MMPGLIKSIVFCDLQANLNRAHLSKQESKEHGIAVMLLVVVLIFFVCNISALVINILELFLTDVSQNQKVSLILVS